MKNNICCLFNIGPHYRESIYKLIDIELGCDFYFGDEVESPMKLMDYSLLKGYKKTVKNKYILGTGFLWQSTLWKLAFKNYKHYIITGSPYIVSNWIILLVSIFTKKKVYAWTHGMKGNSSIKKKMLEKIFYNLCHRIFLYGEYSKNIMINESFNEKKLVPLYNSLNYEYQLEIRKKLQSSDIFKAYFGNDNPVLIYIGRIQKSKKVDLLVQAIRNLKNQFLECNLVIIGKDVDGNHIPEMINELKIESNVWLYGPCFEEEEIGNLIYNSTVCVSPGLIGLTAIHSLTYGTPVITSNDFKRHGPEFEAIIPEVSGAFFEKNNLNDLCSKIKLFTNLNAHERNKFRVRAYQIVDEKYNPNYQLSIIKKEIGI